ncbi:MAG: hypothetical protein KDD60_09085 [Bdellovibrionales bacterium]|nr:hypothetical protein [Bdellovibrionales bacterium]
MNIFRSIQHRVGLITPRSLRSALQDGESIARTLRVALERRLPKESSRTLELGAADTFLDELLGVDSSPLIPKESNAGSTPFVSASVSAILRMLDALNLQSGDVLCDVGAGRFRIPILAHLLTELPTMGVELDSELAESAKKTLFEHHISFVRVLQGDACTADLSQANIFSFNLPFSEEVLQRFLKHIKPLARDRRIVIYPFCWHYPFWQVPWLSAKRAPGKDHYLFVSKSP